MFIQNVTMTDVKVGVLMGSSSDWPVMKKAVELLEQFSVPYEKAVVSAHRMPDEMFRYAEKACTPPPSAL